MITNEQKQEMLRLRAQGWTIVAIAAAFNLEHSTVSYHLQRPNEPVQVRPHKRGEGRIPRKPVPYRAKLPTVVAGKSTVVGKSYLDYVREDMMRKVERDTVGYVTRVTRAVKPPSLREVKKRLGYGMRGEWDEHDDHHEDKPKEPRIPKPSPWRPKWGPTARDPASPSRPRE